MKIISQFFLVANRVSAERADDNNSSGDSAMDADASDVMKQFSVSAHENKKKNLVCKV